MQHFRNQIQSRQTTGFLSALARQVLLIRRRLLVFRSALALSQLTSRRERAGNLPLLSQQHHCFPLTCQFSPKCFVRQCGVKLQ